MSDFPYPPRGRRSLKFRALGCSCRDILQLAISVSPGFCKARPGNHSWRSHVQQRAASDVAWSRKLQLAPQSLKLESQSSVASQEADFGSSGARLRLQGWEFFEFDI